MDAHVTPTYIGSIVLAGVVAWLLGAAWYAPALFGKSWVKAHRFTDEDLAVMKANQMRAMAGTLVAMLIIASVLRIFLAHLGADSVSDGMGWAFHAWLGFALPLAFIGYLYANKRPMSLVIDLGYQLAAFLIMGAILGYIH